MWLPRLKSFCHFLDILISFLPRNGQEIDKLEGEDEIKIKHLKGECSGALQTVSVIVSDSLKGDDAIFTDLHVTSKEIPEVRTTW